MSMVVCTLYGLTLLSCVLGMYYQHFKTNLLQRIGLALLGFWLVYRISFVSKHMMVASDDVMVALSLATISLGSLTKMIAERHAKNRRPN